MPQKLLNAVPLRSLGALCVLCVSALVLTSCVPYPADGPDAPQQPQQSETTPGQFPGLDPGFTELQSLHFDVSGYGQGDTQHAADQAEASYNRIMVDTDLYSFKPSGLYKIVIYGSQEEYLKKTGQPSWSGGVAVGNSIYTYSGPAMDMTIAHEMTHLIFYEFMNTMNPDYRWVNEGLAVYEQQKAALAEGYRGDLFGNVRQSLHLQPIPMDQMIKLAPASEPQGTVDLWYAEAESMVEFMIVRGGGLGFAQFMQGLHDGKDFDNAIASAYPGQWGSLAGFYQAWQYSLQ